MLGALFRTMGPFAPPPPAGAQPAAAVGLARRTCAALIGDRVEWRSLERHVLDITAFEHPRDYGEFFKARYGPTIGVRANAERNGRAAEFDAALDAFCDEWNLGTDERGRASRWSTCSPSARAI